MGQRNQIKKALEPYQRPDGFPNEIGAVNVIYMLVDTKKKLFYIGETVDLVKRLLQKYSVIPYWDYFRYDLLPKEFSPFRVDIERMLIRGHATIMKNKKEVNFINISDYELTNEKIDK